MVGVPYEGLNPRPGKPSRRGDGVLWGCLPSGVVWAPSEATREGHLEPEPLHPIFFGAHPACPEWSF